MKKYIFLVLVIPQFLFSQDWVESMQDSDMNFYDIQQEFNNFWSNRTIEKGKGWKQFKRWENFMEPRVFPDGVMNPEILFEEYQSIQKLLKKMIYFLLFEERKLMVTTM